MHNLLIIFLAFLKLAGEMLVTVVSLLICLIIREIYQSIKNKRRVI
jgi:hypothetical protein